MPELRIEIQDLQEGDIILPSGREVLDNTVKQDTPVGHRYVHLKNSNNDESQWYTFRGDIVITVRRS